MAKGSLEISTFTQPAVGNTVKGQKRLQLKDEYDAKSVNAELDYVHERLNKIVVETAAITDLSGSATLADVITRVNDLTQILRNAGLLKTE